MQDVKFQTRFTQITWGKYISSSRGELLPLWYKYTYHLQNRPIRSSVV